PARGARMMVVQENGQRLAETRVALLHVALKQLLLNLPRQIGPSGERGLPHRPGISRRRVILYDRPNLLPCRLSLAAFLGGSSHKNAAARPSIPRQLRAATP